MIQIEPAQDRNELIAFLKAHEDYSLFLLSNLETYGPTLGVASYSGNYKLARDHGKVIAVFCLVRSGTLLIQSERCDATFFDTVVQSCLKENIPVTGVLGEWSFCSSFWQYLKDKRIISSETFVSKEVLYAADLQHQFLEPQSNVRLLQGSDWEQWIDLRMAYIEEMKLPSQQSMDEIREEFERDVELKIAWGLFHQGELVSIADLNAKAMDLGQVGGVFTVPRHRKKGLSSAVMRQLMHDAKHLHNLRKLIIFTGEDNVSARKVYESLGVAAIGNYALLFGIPF
ncbi:MAG: GNAT family N-acetyltransferase [Verrucomicrobia bacterium]|nr:GNAT family N-acetyltransferase [Verrucomicrobiota bacterium]